MWRRVFLFALCKQYLGRSQWPSGLRCGSAAARLLGLWVRIPQGAWISVCCECCVLSGRGLCVGLMTRPEESYRLWWVVLCVFWKPLEWGGPGPLGGCRTKNKQTKLSRPINHVWILGRVVELFFKIFRLAMRITQPRVRWLAHTIFHSHILINIFPRGYVRAYAIILIEDIPWCFNSLNKINWLISPKHNNKYNDQHYSIAILGC